MYPILARYGPFFLYSYNVLMGLGLLSGIGLTLWLEKRDGQARPDWFDGLLLSLAAGLVGGRVVFVWANWSYFRQEPGEIGLVWRGGLIYYGALSAGLLALWLWSIWKRRDFGVYADLFAPAFVLASAFGWLACYLEGCVYGREILLDASWLSSLAADLPDSYGVFALRYQTQLLGLFFCLPAFLVALGFRRRLAAGQLFWITLAAMTLGRLVVSTLRGDAVPIAGQFRLDSVLEASIFVICVILALTFGRRQPSNKYRQPFAG